MILIGQYDSPFVRRVGIALTLYGFAFDHRPWSTFGDADKIAPYNPLTRVPTLVLDDGEVLIESAAILDHLDERAGDRALVPRRGPERRGALKTCALAMGLAEKCVSLVYERVLHPETSAVWIARCERQIGAVLEPIETSGAHLVTAPSDTVGHAEIAIGVALRFLGDAHPALFDRARYPRLTRHCESCEAMPAFRAIEQRFIPPA